MSLRDKGAAKRRTCLDNPVIAEHLEAIRALCREYGVRRLEVFGSVCAPEFDPERSDVDFLVEYPEGYQYGQWASRVEDLRVALANLLVLDRWTCWGTANFGNFGNFSGIGAWPTTRRGAKAQVVP